MAVGVVKWASRRGWGSSTRIAPSFCLECIAQGRSSNWLHRRFGRIELSRPLETKRGAPIGHIAAGEGGRTAPTVDLSAYDKLWLLFDYWCDSWFMLYFKRPGRRIGQRYENRPQRRAGGQVRRGAVASPAAFLYLRNWHNAVNLHGVWGRAPR